MRNALAIAAVGCWVLAIGLFAGFRAAGRAELAPGNDTAFTLLMLVPVALFGGAVLSAVGLALGRAPRRPLLAALILNGGSLVFLVGMGGWGLISYQGR